MLAAIANLAMAAGLLARSLARSLSRRLGGDVILDTSYTSGARFIFSTPINAG